MEEPISTEAIPPPPPPPPPPISLSLVQPSQKKRLKPKVICIFRSLPIIASSYKFPSLLTTTITTTTSTSTKRLTMTSKQSQISSWLALLAFALPIGSGDDDLRKKVSDLIRDMKLTQFKVPYLCMSFFKTQIIYLSVT